MRRFASLDVVSYKMYFEMILKVFQKKSLF